MYSGSVEVQVSIPYAMLVKLFLMWIAIILLSRLVIFLITIRTPLTGRMRMNTSTMRRTRALRTALTAVILIVFSSSVVYSIVNSLNPFYWLDWHSVIADYEIEGSYRNPLTPEKAELIAAVPGIKQVEIFKQGNDRGENEKLRISYSGLEERYAPQFYVLDDRYWPSYDFGDDLEAFRSGDVVLLAFGYGEVGKRYYEMYHDPIDEFIYPAPGEKITLRAVDGDGSIVATDTVDVVVRDIEKDISRSIGGVQPYTVVMSETYFRKLVSKLVPGKEWGNNMGGYGEYGYCGVLATADSNADDLSAGVTLERLCKENNWPFLSRHEELIANRQRYTQDIIKLFACGGCVALVALLLFGGALSLEAESEKRSYSILRAIGMSRKQIKRKIFITSLIRKRFRGHLRMGTDGRV